MGAPFLRFARSFRGGEELLAERGIQVSSLLSDNRADLARGRVPSLVLQCRDDAIAPEAVGAYVRTWPGARCTGSKRPGTRPA